MGTASRRSGTSPGRAICDPVGPASRAWPERRTAFCDLWLGLWLRMQIGVVRITGHVGIPIRESAVGIVLPGPDVQLEVARRNAVAVRRARVIQEVSLHGLWRVRRQEARSVHIEVDVLDADEPNRAAGQRFTKWIPIAPPLAPLVQNGSGT